MAAVPGWVGRPTQVATLVLALAIGANATSHAGGLNSLGWMAGSWAAEKGGMRQEEHWMAPRGNMMVGMHRDTRPGKPSVFEYFRIEQRDDGVFYLSQPGGDPVTAFKLKDQSERRVVFENAEHDYPQRVIYWMDKPGVLHARIEGTIKGEQHSTDWTWPKAKLTP